MATAAVPVRPRADEKSSEWLSELGVKPGEWYIDTKARAKRAMRCRSFSPVARFHIRMGLATMGFRQELGVMLVDGKEVPITPDVLCRDTGVNRKHFRQYWDQYEADGFGRSEGLTKGSILLYGWAIPRERAKKNCHTIGDNPPDVPPELVKRLNSVRVPLPPDIVTDPVTISGIEERLARIEAERLSLREYLESHRAGTAYKDERNGKELNHRESSSSSVEDVIYVEEGTTTTAEDIISSSGPDEPVRTEVAGNGSLTASASRTTDRGGLPADVTESPAMPSPQPAPEDVSPIVEAVRRHHNLHLSRANARDIVNACRDKLADPSISPEETARFVSMVSPIRPDGTIKSPPGFLKKAVAKEMTAEELRVLRESRTETLPAAITYDGTEEDDPELSSERCYKCGGETIRYASGFVSRCKCQANGRVSP